MKIIGITGVARAGKDTFCQLLKECYAKNGITAKRFALADKLKSEMAAFFLESFGIDIFNCSPEDKELIRPLLVEYGRAKRIQSNGRYWTSLVEQEIKSSEQDCDVAIVTDIRYAEYIFDEVDWLKSLGGSLIHLSRFYDGKLLEAPNADEARNDPKLLILSDLNVEWETDLDKAFQEVEKVYSILNNL